MRMLVGFAAWWFGCPHHAIAGARMFRSDQHGGIRPRRVLFRANRQLSMVDWDAADQAEWTRITSDSNATQPMLDCFHG